LEEKKILIVEDEVIFALLLSHQLGKKGYDIVDSVTTGKSAIESAKKYLPDYILMDIRLADNITGIEAAKQIINFSHSQIIFMTAYNDEGIINNALELKPLAIINKPFNIDEIDKFIN
jgi:CheY-like chemotaxis protein